MITKFEFFINLLTATTHKKVSMDASAIKINPLIKITNFFDDNFADLI
jgi:hypothetical protein